ncbi:hypothetical protein T4E_9466 [Trichinella pseudospiralis]|uniref:Uncharacterized protein n=1 Tax=Trichinella pseudospiralis TaxID=6337 RepID=A0A0V0YKD3_TRIPS|nr:hypothetical protein T4E_9466 [Trichinella pseudospiralis]
MIAICKHFLQEEYACNCGDYCFDYKSALRVQQLTVGLNAKMSANLKLKITKKKKKKKNNNPERL